MAWGFVDYWLEAYSLAIHQPKPMPYSDLMASKSLSSFFILRLILRIWVLMVLLDT